MNSSRESHTATLLPNGMVLVAGGYSGGWLSSAELYNPATGAWSLTGAMITAREGHAATLLPNGKVLVAGGSVNNTDIANAELYDPVTGKWTATSSLNAVRGEPSATLLPGGKVLFAGGYNVSTINNSAELYDPGLGYTNTSQPQITSATSPLNLGGSLIIAGAQFRGASEGSYGSAQDSSTDYPLVQLRGIESGQTTFLIATNWSTNSFASAPVWNFPPGWTLATVFVNGIQSTSSVVSLSVPMPVAMTLTGAQKPSNTTFQFSFTNSVGAQFNVLATTNLSLPLTNWPALGGVVEISPGQFQFIDTNAASYPRRFYKVSSP
jgi:hypothetical protein